MGRTFPKPTVEEAAAPPPLAVVRGEETPASTAPARRLRFGDFELETGSGELERDGEPIKLQPQPAKVLQYLAERSGQVVSRRELQVHLWGEDRFVDFEQGLNYCIKTVRRALGDSAESPTYVETIPRRGYRFCAAVEVVEAAAEPSPAPPGAAGLPKVTLRLLAALAVGLGLAAGWTLLRPAPETAPATLRIAVLPFENLSRQPDDEPLAAGLTAELLTRLAREHGKQLGVIGRASAMTYRGTQKSVAEIGAELEADLLLTGGIQRAGETVRISTRLVQVDGETYLWADVAERRPGETDWEAWTGEVTGAVARELGLAPANAPAPAFTLPPELYEGYLEGIFFSNLETPEGRRRGLATLAEVRRRAPGFAPAHLAWAQLRNDQGSPREFLPEVMAALEQAIALDPGFAEAHLEMARMRGMYRYEWERGLENVRRALELNPRSAEAHNVHAMYLAADGQVEEAVAVMNQALVIDPLSGPMRAHTAWSYFFARQYEEAVEVSRRLLEIDPRSVSAHSTIIHALVKLGDRAGALAQAERMQERDFASLEEFWRHNLELFESRPGVLATAEIQLGRHEAAIESLLTACRELAGWPLPFLRVDPRFDAIREHPRFGEVLACVGLDG